MLKKIFIPMILISIVLTTAPCFGQDDEIAYTANDKFIRGALNLTTWYLEAPMTAYEISVDENPLIGILYGLPVGVAKSIMRCIIGVVEISTFPFEPYEPILEPEFLIIKR